MTYEPMIDTPQIEHTIKDLFVVFFFPKFSILIIQGKELGNWESFNIEGLLFFVMPHKYTSVAQLLLFWSP